MSVRPRLALCAAFVLAAIFAAPLFPALNRAFGAVCHQTPARCFEWFGVRLPVCARCLGIYAGALAAGLKPVRAPSCMLWAAIGATALEFLSQANALGARFVFAAILCWLGTSRLLPTSGCGKLN